MAPDPINVILLVAANTNVTYSKVRHEYEATALRICMRHANSWAKDAAICTCSFAANVTQGTDMKPPTFR